MKNLLERITEKLPSERIRLPGFFLIFGPCVIENAELTLEIAETLTTITRDLGVPFIFKASYDKANRTRLDSYRGVGIEEGLAILNQVKETYKIPVLTDVHSVQEAFHAAKVVDVVQVPAFLSRQTDILIAAGKTGKIVNIKKGQFMAPEDIKYAVEKVKSTGNNKVMVTERGTCFGYHNLVNDFRAFKIMRNYAPVIYDVTHSMQQPSALSGVSGGARQFEVMMARAAVAAGVDGIFMEVYPEPEKSPSDAAVIFPLPKLRRLLEELLEIRYLISKFEDWEP